MPESTVQWDEVDPTSIPPHVLHENPQVQELMETRSMEDLEEEISLPHKVENVVLMSPGEWNEMVYTEDSIKDAFRQTDWENEKIRALYWDHEDRKAEKQIGVVENVHMDGDFVKGDLVLFDKEAAIKIEAGAKVGISPKVTGRARNNRMQEFTFDNFSVVHNPAVKTAWINAAMEEGNDRIYVTEVTATMSDNDADESGAPTVEDLAEDEEFREKVQEFADADRDTVAGLLASAFNASEEDVSEAMDEVLEDEAADEEDVDDEDVEEEEAENEERDLDDLADEIMDRIAERAQMPMAFAPSGTEDEDFSEEEVDEFQDFVEEQKKENPEMSFSEIVQEYEDQKKDPAEQAKDELSDKIDERLDSLEEKLETKVEELEAERASQKDPSSEETAQELKEKYNDLSNEELDELMQQSMKQDYNRGVATMPVGENN